MKKLCVLFFQLSVFLIMSSCAMSSCSQQGGPSDVKDDLKKHLVGKWEVVKFESDIIDDSVESPKEGLQKGFVEALKKYTDSLGYKIVWEFHPISNLLNSYYVKSNYEQLDSAIWGISEETYSIQGDVLFIEGKHAPYEFLNKNKTELIIKTEYTGGSPERVRYHSYTLKRMNL